MNLVDTRCIKLSWPLGLSWFFLSQHVNECIVVRICVYGCVQVHKTEGAKASVRVCMSVCCVCCYEYLMCYSVFMRLKDREKQREGKKIER